MAIYGKGVGGRGCLLIHFFRGGVSHPLDIQVVLDTDERVPEEWVPPILVEEFEEMED